jgi:hypothetical protein
MDTTHDVILKMSLSYFLETNATPDTIKDFIERMKRAFGNALVDEAGLFKKLESIHSVSIGTVTMLDDMTDHIEWFNPATNTAIKRELSWHFWDHYKDYLTIRKGWSPKIVDSVDGFSSEILSRIEDPQRQDRWDRRGMVMGSVQSGKTANYTALITKAADAGYKLFIVMAGVHNSLRSQTQSRLNEEFLGYDLDKVQKLTGGERRIGVRRWHEDHKTVYTLTSSNEKGDFKTAIASQSGIFPSNDGPPIILVIKKHTTILKNVINWAQSIIRKEDHAGRIYIPDIPVLLIDDECDYASVNTKKIEIDDNTGRPIEEWDPTKTNQLIRELLSLFDKSAYVGYTATPYANIFIHKDQPHEKYGDDIFPRSFIISLPQPSNYLGPEKVFGLADDPNRGIDGMDPLPLIRSVEDYDNTIPDQHDKTLVIETLPESMKHAIKSFLLSCAARSIRKEGIPHNSMLIHVTRFVYVQRQVHRLVEKELRHLAARIMSGEELDDFKDIWETDYLPSTRDMINLDFPYAVEHNWNEIVNQLHQTTRMVKVKLINGTATDSLDYKEAEIEASNRIQNGENVQWEEKGISVIVIGGDKLSRGLTLEGLSISYYLRATRMYDTLMQMGRWFGYREGYNDLCRIYMTDELFSWYRHIASATKELKEEIDYMSALGASPTEFGLKVRSHPGRLAVTSANKSRDTTKIELSYSGKISETIVFDRKHLRNNMHILSELIKDIGHPCYNVYNPDKPRYQWKNVPSSLILNFLHGYRMNEGTTRLVKPSVLARYIEQQNRNEELIDWEVVIVSKSGTEHSVEIDSNNIGCGIRKASKVSNDSITIKRLVNPTDEHLDMSKEEMKMANHFFESNENIKTREIAVRHIRPENRGLLLIYMIEGEDKAGNKYGTKGEEVVGFAISFPTSENAIPIEYVVNTVWMDEDDHYA